MDLTNLTDSPDLTDSAGGTNEEVFADTRDTLCYATLDNQSAVTGLLETPADLAIVVGGYNSSNTSHLVELCEEILPTYFISSEEKILSPQEILHYDIHRRTGRTHQHWLPTTKRHARSRAHKPRRPPARPPPRKIHPPASSSPAEPPAPTPSSKPSSASSPPSTTPDSALKT